MMTSTSLKNILITCTFLFTVVAAVDGGTSITFEGKDKAPLNKQVKLFVKTYIQRNSKNLYNIKQRSSSPFIMIDSIFKHYGLPVQLKYLAVVESELKIKAVSKVGAVGPWQLMSSTGRILGLKINSHCDERKNYFKSTRAAARYLRDLHEQFGDWFLVFAAYNSGEGAVQSAIRKSGSRNFWVLKHFLPEETQEYVNKFIATCYYFEGSYSPSLLSKTSGTPYLNLSRTFRDTQLEKLTVKKIPHKKNETPEEKFNRILKESEESLQRSNKLLTTTR
ncbi:MAG: lytic transglycosylase domain-containing protein [Bacteroidota bacterium]|nr:lytic transglycosylase domain-containing protein [Bacteroidota bacterium]